MQIRVVTYKDTVDGIAAQYGIPVDRLIYDNQIPYPYRLAVGQALLITENGEGVARQESIRVNGYAYTYIRPWVLEQTLSYLTELSIFSYGFTTEGALVKPPLPTDWMISGAKAAGVMPVLTLTPFGPDGQFNNYLIHAVVSNQAAMEALTANLIAEMEQYGYEGLDIDFEYILASDRQAFVDFVVYMREGIGSLGYPVSVALAPKTSADQRGLLYEGKDYAALGAAADYVFLMTYEWGYTYGPPMAVAPLNKVREVLDYAVTEIAPEKIQMGIPNYGYDWPLPFVRGVTRAQTIGNIQAVQRAITYGVPILFDGTAISPYYYYETGDDVLIRHEVWFQDVRSMEASFLLLKEYGLQGAGYWNVMQLFRANWLLLHDYFIVKRQG